MVGLFGVALGVEVVAGIAAMWSRARQASAEHVENAYDEHGYFLTTYSYHGHHRNRDTALDLAERVGDLRSGS